MNKVNLTIHIIPGDKVMNTIKEFDPARDGKLLSTESNIKVNKAAYGFSIIYNEETFEELSPSVFLTTLIKLFSDNLGTDTIVNTSLNYHYEDEEFDTDVAKSVLDMDDVMKKIYESSRINTFMYERSENVYSVYEDWKSEMQDVENDDDESFDPEDLEYDDSYDDVSSVFDRFISPYMEDDYDDDDESPKKKSHDVYGQSRVFREAKNPKRAINRHGVVIADSKDDIKKDEKIIKSFLKEFIPGNADWKKEFRNDLAKRWIKMYAVSKKQLKHLEKEHRRSKSSKKKSKADDRVLDLTRRLLTVPVDRWSDPTK